MAIANLLNKQPGKITPAVYPLTTSAGRVGLLAGITAGTVTTAEVEASVLHDVAPRQYRKPVVAEGRRFPSVRAAAIWLLRDSQSFQRANYARLLNATEKSIARACNADNVVGYYWSA